MKLTQTARRFAAKTALEAPVVGGFVEDRLVDMHVGVFGDKAERDREAREERLQVFFEVTMDIYVAALDEGYSEEEAREITHVVADFDFYNHGWYEMMEHPPVSLDEEYDRYSGFFSRHSITVEEPLGEFGEGVVVPDAPVVEKEGADA